MEGMLKVTPEKLLSASEEFRTSGNTINGITDEMMNHVNSMKNVWTGEAADTYSGRFLSLQADMDIMQRMINEHVSDLQEMGRQYQTAETTNMNEGSALAINIIS